MYNSVRYLIFLIKGKKKTVTFFLFDKQKYGN